MQIIEMLSAKIGGDRVISGNAVSADYCHDEYPGDSFTPDAVVEAGSTEEISAVLKLCSEHGVPVTVRGAGTGQAGGSVPVKGGVVLSLKGMNKILEFNETERTLRVQPGVLLQDVKAEAEKHGLYYPPDPGEKTATIGGNAATNAAGPCAVKYGTTKDYILNAVIVLADGTVTVLAGHEAVLGSEGTLGVITELTLRLIDKPNIAEQLGVDYSTLRRVWESDNLCPSTECAMKHLLHYCIKNHICMDNILNDYR